MSRTLDLAAGMTLALAMAACGDSGTAPGPALLPDAGDLDAQVTIDAASITERPDLCAGLSHPVNPVFEVELFGDPPPPLGGKVTAGTYDLSELDTYAGTGAADAGASDGGEGPPSARLTGQAARITIVVSEFAMRTSMARGSTAAVGTAPESAHAVLYRVDGTSLVETSVCPTTALPVRVPFSAVGGGLAIFVDAKHREVYSLRP